MDFQILLTRHDEFVHLDEVFVVFVEIRHILLVFLNIIEGRSKEDLEYGLGLFVAVDVKSVSKRFVVETVTTSFHA